MSKTRKRYFFSADRQEFDLSDLRCAMLPLAGGIFYPERLELFSPTLPFPAALDHLDDRYDPAGHSA